MNKRELFSLRTTVAYLLMLSFDIVGADVYILEDAACAFGTFVDGRACGTLSDFGCWSFDAMKC